MSTATPILTEEQAKAIGTRRLSVSLSAGAGCGKTFVLTERFLSHFASEKGRAREVLEPSDLSRLVAITFTERAAREMRKRVRDKCYQRLRDDPAQADRWAALLRNLDSARISTIHSFCGALLRSRAVEAGVDPQFQVLEQVQSETLLWEVIDQQLRVLIAARDKDIFALAARFDLSWLPEMIRHMVSESTAEELSAWLHVGPDEQVRRWEEFCRDEVFPGVARNITEGSEARRIVEMLTEYAPANAAMQARRQELLRRLPALAEQTEPREIVKELAAIREQAKVQGGGGAKCWRSHEAYEEFKNSATRLRDSIDKVVPILAFDARTAREAAVVGHQLLAIAAGVAAEYARKKQQLAALDFNDLLRRAKALLVDPANDELRQRLSSHIHLLLVDEFQDTDPLQVELVRALCGDAIHSGKLFFVGDYKQSIYRFRGADPTVFRKLRDETAAAGRLSLTWNFRSQGAILDFVNGLFRKELGLGYESLRPDRPQVTAKPAIEFLWAPSPPDTKEARADLVRREADWIARRIRGLIDGGEEVVCDVNTDESKKPQTRAASYRDFAILFRALSDVELYEDALRRHGIDYYLVGGHAFYAQQEIFDLLNLLRTLDSPSDAVSLVGVLRSGFFALADETIFWLAQHPEGFIGGFDAKELRDEISPEQRQRVTFAAETIAELRGLKDRLTICQLIELALARTGYDAALVNEFMGDRKLANLRKLVEQARTFDRSGFFGLTDFIAQLSEFVSRQPDEPLAATHSEQTDVVRLMTIHQAKGLEFPIVIVPDCDRPSHNFSRPARFDPTLGPLVRLPATADGDPPIGGYELWNCLEAIEDLQEIKRLLYVATTRAADYLILSGGVAKLGDTRGPWTKLLARHFDLPTGRFLDELPKNEDEPQVKVTTLEPPLVARPAARRKLVDLERVIAEAMAIGGTADAPLPSVDAIQLHPEDRRHYSFSRLASNLKVDEDREIERGEEVTTSAVARGLGTLVHSVLAAVDFAKPANVAALVGRHAERQLISDSAALEEATALVEQFLTTPRARAMAAARQSYTEAEFLLAWPPRASEPDGPILSGYLDRLYQDAAGDWHVVDFKTNRVPPHGLDDVAAGYELQMLVYGLAAEQILKAPPKSLVLHFLRTGEEFCFDWNAAAHQRVVELVNRGMASAANESPALED